MLTLAWIYVTICIVITREPNIIKFSKVIITEIVLKRKLWDIKFLLGRGVFL